MALNIPFEDAEAMADLERRLSPPDEEIIFHGKKMKVAVGKKVGRIGGLQVSIFSDEHAPPHVCVSIQGESANYRISDAARLTPGFGRHDRYVIPWLTANKQKMITEWDNTRPSNCPVGKYREPDSQKNTGGQRN